MTKNTIAIFLAVGLTLAWVTTASAIRITYEDPGGAITELFFDSFEDDTAATAATDAAPPNPIWDGATIGWNSESNGPTASTEEVQVLDSVVGSTQAYMPNSAAEGNNYLSVARDEMTGTGLGARTGVELGQTYTTGKLTAEFMAWIPGVGVDGDPNQVFTMDMSFTGDLSNEWNTRVALARPTNDTNSVRLVTDPPHDFNSDDTGVSYLSDQWQLWVLESDLDAGTTTVTVAGNTSVPFANASNAVAALNVATPGGNSAYAIDAITLAAPGDFNNDTLVNTEDFDILRDHMGAHIEGPVDFSSGDNNRDGRVDLVDFAEFKELFPGVVAAAANTPEPASVALLTCALASLALVTRRCRRLAQ